MYSLIRDRFKGVDQACESHRIARGNYVSETLNFFGELGRQAVSAIGNKDIELLCLIGFCEPRNLMSLPVCENDYDRLTHKDSWVLCAVCGQTDCSIVF